MRSSRGRYSQRSGGRGPRTPQHFVSKCLLPWATLSLPLAMCPLPVTPVQSQEWGGLGHAFRVRSPCSGAG